MTQFRVSRALTRKGISPEKQGLIFFACLNINSLDETFKQKVLNTCIEVGGEDYQALYRFLTDAYVNHVYICNVYFISKARLFALKRDFYLKLAQNWE
ncbi:MAG: hypothetical protein Q4G33_07460 [bacterium]|nr:hypothetical protein [bacterium]